MFLEATSEIAARITGAIRNAARATGASFEYLLDTAQRESNLDPDAKASTSSATGLFQFIDQTWLETLKTAGPELGYARYAETIVQTASGQYVVPDPAQRQAVMQLRNDPAAASAMAGAFTKKNAALLADRLGRQPTNGELYIAHFLGSAGASQLIGTASTAPNAKAADLFPGAARANRTIFYDVRGKARTASQVYDALVSRHDSARPRPAQTPGGRSAASSAEKASVTTAAAARTPFAITAADTAETASTGHQAYGPESGPVFHTLFRTGGGGPVSSVVSELWGAKNVQFPVDMRPAAAAPTPGPRSAPGRPLDLFQFLRPEIRSQASRSA